MSQDTQELGDIITSWVANSMVKDPTDVAVKDVYHKQAEEFVFKSCATEMLRVSDKGFWVRGVKVIQSPDEANTVYRSFRDWLVWAQLNRD